MDNLVLVEKKKNWALLTLNASATLNAMSVALLDALDSALDEVNADPELRAVAVTGTGKAFIGGGDLSYMKNLNAQESMAYVDKTMRMVEKMTSSSKIFIAAINGYALGGGCEFALACDIRIAAEKAKIGFPEVTLGILPGAGGTQRLPRIIGMGRAMEMILTGSTISAQKALEWGMVSAVVPDEELMAKTEEYANKIARTAPIGVAGAKSSICQASNMPLDAGLLYERRMWGLCFGTQDKAEGMQAFFEKRPPVYKGE